MFKCINLLTLFILLIIIVCIYNPRKICRSIRLPFVNNILFNYCGFLLPLFSSLVLIFSYNVYVKHLVLLSSLAVVIAVMHTYVANKMILINVVRYSVLLTFLSILILSMRSAIEDVYYLLPFSSVVGIALGCDIIPYIFMYRRLKNEHKVLIVGGYVVLDSINISLILVLIILFIFKLLSNSII